MGFLTTFTVHNDSADEILKYPKEFAQEVYDGCVNGKGRRKGRFALIQQTRHADNHTFYCHAGNGLFEVSAYSDTTGRLMVENPQFMKDIITEMSNNVRILKRALRETSKIK